MSETSTLIAYNGKISREELARIPTPPATATHEPIPHHQIVEALVDTLVPQYGSPTATDGLSRLITPRP